MNNGRAFVFNMLSKQKREHRQTSESLSDILNKYYVAQFDLQL